MWRLTTSVAAIVALLMAADASSVSLFAQTAATTSSAEGGLSVPTAPSTASSATASPTTAPAEMTPPATSMPYQQGTTPSYSSWPPPTSTATGPGYQSTQPTYQATPPPPANSTNPGVSGSSASACPTGAVPGTPGCP